MPIRVSCRGSSRASALSAGAILRERGSVHGTATAASIWGIGIAGAAVGFGMYHIAIILALVTLLTLRFLLLKKELRDE